MGVGAAAGMQRDEEEIAESRSRCGLSKSVFRANCAEMCMSTKHGTRYSARLDVFYCAFVKKEIAFPNASITTTAPAANNARHSRFCFEGVIDI